MKIKGKFKVNFDGVMISATFEGMFNLATSKDICSQVERYIEGLNGKRFYLLIDLSKYQGSTPEAHEEGNRHAMWLESQNCGGKAVVSNQQVMLNIIRNEQKFLNQSKILNKTFIAQSEAKDWLNSLLQQHSKE